MENPPLPKVRGPACKLSAKARDELEKLAKKKGSGKWNQKTWTIKWEAFTKALNCKMSQSAFKNIIQRRGSEGDKRHFRWTSDQQQWINDKHKEECHAKLYEEFKIVFKGKKQPSYRAFQNRMLESSKQTVPKKLAMERKKIDKSQQKAAKATAGEKEDNLQALAHAAAIAAAADDSGGCDGGGCSSGRQRTSTNGSCLTTHTYRRSTPDPTPPPPPPQQPDGDTAPTAGDGSPAVSPVSPADDPLFSGSSDGVCWEDIRGSPQVSPGGSAAGWQAVSPVGSSSSAWLLPVATLSPDGGPADSANGAAYSANGAADSAAGMPLLP